MAIIKKERLAALNEVLLLIDKIINEPVKRDGSPAKELKIRNAVRDLILGKAHEQGDTDENIGVGDDRSCSDVGSSVRSYPDRHRARD